MKNHFYIKGWAPTLVLKQRPGGTRKWSSTSLCGSSFSRRPTKTDKTIEESDNYETDKKSDKHLDKTSDENSNKISHKKKNRTENWIRISKVTDKNQTKTLAGTQTKNRTRSPFFLLLVQPEAYNPEASNFPLVCLEPCWGFRVYKLLLELKTLNVDKTASKLL